jgi:hypothetical protein
MNYKHAETAANCPAEDSRKERNTKTSTGNDERRDCCVPRSLQHDNLLTP